MDHPLFLLITLLCLSTPATAVTNFDYPSFSANDPNITVLNATTKGDNSGHPSILLTSSQIFSSVFNASGRAFYSLPVQLYDPSNNLTTNFTTYFEFQIFYPNNDNSNATSGGGFCFFLTSQNRSALVPRGSAGGMLGLFNQTSNGDDSNQIVAVEFDTFRDPWDSSANHVGINVNSVVSIANRTWNNTLVSNDIYGARISYDGGSNLLSVFLKDPDIPNDFGSLRFSQRVNLREVLPERVIIGFSASTGTSVSIQSIRSWNFTSTLAAIPVAGEEVGGDGDGGNGFQMWMIGLIIGLLLGAAAAFAIVKGKRNQRKKLQKQRENSETEDEDEDEEEDDSMDGDIGWGSTGPKKFSYKELVTATENFSEEGKLGQGGFGGVYKGYLPELNAQVAVKKVSSGSKQGKKEYISEVMTISKLRHRNLVQLVGYSHKKGSFVLVYEFMHNGSLDTHLFGKKVPLPWPTRFKIAQGLASALLYLHEEWEQCVVHRDIKSSNVMLDSNFNAKLGDFGLAKLIDHNLGSQTTVVAGTMGYMAPEYLMTSKASKESDVYSFGVVALEIACGRKAVEHREEESKVVLVNWVWELYGQGKLLEAADEAIVDGVEEEDEIVRLMTVGLWCAHPDHTMRPSIRQAIQVLNSESVVPTLPAQMPIPSFYAPRVGNGDSYSLSTYTVSSEVTGEMSPASTSSTQNLIYSGRSTNS